MLTLTKNLIFASLIVISSSCASIVSKTSYPVTVDSSPRDASVTITDRHGTEVYSGKTPALVRLKSGAGFFKAAQYAVTISKPGFASKTVNLRASVNGWYFGNIVFGGVIGFLIVDPATGAMYRLNTLDVNETLASTPGNASASAEPKLRIYDISEIPASWKSKLVAMK